MNFFARRTIKFPQLLLDLAVSATGSFALVRGFRLAAIEEKGSDTGA
jgi:hypothetical protein